MTQTHSIEDGRMPGEEMAWRETDRNGRHRARQEQAERLRHAVDRVRNREALGERKPHGYSPAASASSFPGSSAFSVAARGAVSEESMRGAPGAGRTSRSRITTSHRQPTNCQGSPMQVPLLTNTWWLRLQCPTERRTIRRPRLRPVAAGLPSLSPVRPRWPSRVSRCS